MLDLFARTFLDPGDVVIAEGPTTRRGAVLQRRAGGRAPRTARTPTASTPSASRRCSTTSRGEGLRAKYLYTIPRSRTPAVCTTTLERRERLVELAAERDLVVLEDNPYSLLRYEGEPVATLRSLDRHERVAYLGTFSKIFSPGVRVGWIEAPSPILQRINLMKQAADLCSSPFMQLLVTRFFASDDGAAWRAWVDRLCGIYRLRRDAMVEAIGEHFPPGVQFTTPEGGLFLWRRCRAWSTRPTCSPARSRRTWRSCRAAGVPGRHRHQLDAAQLQRGRRGPHPRGHPPHRRGHREVLELARSLGLEDDGGTT